MRTIAKYCLAVLLHFILWLDVQSQTITICKDETQVDLLGEDRNDWTTDPVQSEGYLHDFTVPSIPPSGTDCGVFTSIDVCVDLQAVNINGAADPSCNLQGVYGNVWQNPPALNDPNSGEQRDDEIIGGAGWNIGQSCIDVVAAGYDLCALEIIGVDVVPAVDPNTSGDCPTTGAVSSGFVTLEYQICIDFNYSYIASPIADAGLDFDLQCSPCLVIGADPVANSGFTYEWSTGDAGTIVTSGNPNNQDNGQITVCPTSTTTYTLTVTDPNTCCTGTDEMTITVLPNQDFCTGCGGTNPPTDPAFDCIACVYETPQAPADVAANCPGIPVDCPNETGENVTICAEFVSQSTSVDISLVLTTNCGSGPGPGGGNVANFTWEFYDDMCGLITSGDLSSLTVSGLTCGETYNYCLNFDVPSGSMGSICNHSWYYPYVVSPNNCCVSEAGAISISK